MVATELLANQGYDEIKGRLQRGEEEVKRGKRCRALGVGVKAQPAFLKQAFREVTLPLPKGPPPY